MPERSKLLKRLAVLLGLVIAALAIGLYVHEILAYPSLTYFAGPVPGGDYYSFWAPARLVWFGEAYGAYDPAVLTPMLRTMMATTPGAYSSPLYYPPSYLLFLAPFGLLDYFASFMAFALCGTGLYLFTLWFITRWRWFVPFMLCSGAIWVNLVCGQNGLYTASLFGLGFVLLPTAPLAAGVMFGLLTFKPQLGLLIPVALLALRQYRSIGMAALAFLALFVLAGVLFGPDIWLWSASGMFTAGFNLAAEQRLWGRMPSAFALLRMSGLAPGQALLLHFLLVVPVVALTWVIWRRSRNYNLNSAATACLALLASPFLYDYDMALLGVAIAFLAPEIARSGWWWGERVVLPLAMIWPIAVGWTALFTGMQLGLLGPVLLLLVVLRRIVKELKVAPTAAPALNTEA